MTMSNDQRDAEFRRVTGLDVKGSVLTGYDSEHYDSPFGKHIIAELIEFKNMNFNRGNIFKAAYRLGDKPGTTERYDLEKIIFYAQRELARLGK